MKLIIKFFFFAFFVILTPLVSSAAVFNHSRGLGDSGPDILALQVFLNNSGFLVATSGPGSEGRETSFFGPATRRAVKEFQEFYASDILSLRGLVSGTGRFDPLTREKAEKLNTPPLMLAGGASSSDGPSSPVSSGASSAPLASSDAPRGSSGSGGGEPFGGLISKNVYCICSSNRWITHSGVAGNKNLIYEPGQTKLYEFKEITKTNVWILGTAGGSHECVQLVGEDCVTIYTGPYMYMVGTSKTGGGGGGGGGGGDTPPDDPSQPPLAPDQCQRMGTNPNVYPSRGTGYFPDSSEMEGGFVDMRDRPLQTLQQYLAGQASYVSVAMDKGVFPYGTELCIPQLEQKYNMQIPFRVVDTGGAFMGQGTSRIDICTANSAASMDSTINGALQLVTNTTAKK